jgi:hypothetical protein
MTVSTENLTLGRGELHFSLFKPGTFTPAGFRYLGNSPDFALTIASTMLKHYGADRGIKEENRSVPLQSDRSGKLTLDDISLDNMALQFQGAKSTISTTASAGHTDTFDAVTPGLSYQIGLSDATPAGVRNLGVTVVKDDAGSPVTFVLNTDYTLDTVRGTLAVIDGGDITDGTNVVVTYALLASTVDQVVTSSDAVFGALQYRAFNPTGKDIDYYFPYVNVSPNGDLNLKGDTWQQLPLMVDILKAPGREAIYANGQPYTP